MFEVRMRFALLRQLSKLDSEWFKRACAVTVPVTKYTFPISPAIRWESITLHQCVHKFWNFLPSWWCSIAANSFTTRRQNSPSSTGISRSLVMVALGRQRVNFDPKYASHLSHLSYGMIEPGKWAQGRRASSSSTHCVRNSHFPTS